MARKYDIAERLMRKNQRPTIKIDEDHEYRVNTSAPAAMMIQDVVKNDGAVDEYDIIKKVITVAIGQDALAYIESQEPSLPALSLIVTAIMAAMSDEDIETMEKSMEEDDAARFQKPSKKK